jgi:hypothetical protein
LPIREEFPPRKLTQPFRSHASFQKKEEIFQKGGKCSSARVESPERGKFSTWGKLSRAALTVYDSGNVHLEMQFPPIPPLQPGVSSLQACTGTRILLNTLSDKPFVFEKPYEQNYSYLSPYRLKGSSCSRFTAYSPLPPCQVLLLQSPPLRRG